MDLRGRNVLITGASRGIGAAMARRLADRGARLALVARSRGALDGIARTTGGLAIDADLADRATVHGLLPRVEEALGGAVDVLVNNAAHDLTGATATLDSEAIDATLQLNLATPIALTRAVLPGMIARGGAIVNVSSIGGAASLPGMTVYSASKAGLSQFTRTLRSELSGRPVAVTLVELGPIETMMLDQVMSYGPARAAVEQGRKLGIVPRVSADEAAREIVESIEQGRAAVRVPWSIGPFSFISSLPQMLSDLMFHSAPRA